MINQAQHSCYDLFPRWGGGATEQDVTFVASYFADVAGEQHCGKANFLLQGCHPLGKQLGHARVFIHLEGQKRI